MSYEKLSTLLSEKGTHSKVAKNEKVGVYSAIMHLAPADDSGYEVCPMRSAGCTAACLNTAGFHYPKKQIARVNRTKMFFEDRDAFMYKLTREIHNLECRAGLKGLQPGIRLNGTSDIPWENIPVLGQKNIMAVFPKVQFMDYTKRTNRRDLPENYRLVFSRSEENHVDCIAAIQNGINVAVVFKEVLPAKFGFTYHQDLRVIDGDKHDWRWGDYDDYPDERVIVGLLAKGHKAKQDKTGFVVDNYGRMPCQYAP